MTSKVKVKQNANLMKIISALKAKLKTSERRGKELEKQIENYKNYGNSKIQQKQDVIDKMRYILDNEDY